MLIQFIRDLTELLYGPPTPKERFMWGEITFEEWAALDGFEVLPDDLWTNNTKISASSAKPKN